MRINREFDSNVIGESDLQLEKQCDPRISTVEGITIGSNDEFENVNDSVRINREFTSNETDESELQYNKESEPRISIVVAISPVDDVEKWRINF
jgi:hypothetical protein